MAGDVRPVPEGVHTVTPTLVVNGADAAIDFYVQAFDATPRGHRFRDPDGKVVHAELTIGDTVVFIRDGGHEEYTTAPGAKSGGVTATMAISVPDVDVWWERAVGAGCDVLYPLADHFYGDRGGRLRDPFGQQWMLSTHIEDLSVEEVDRRMAAWVAEQEEG
jgi:PhnB protein